MPRWERWACPCKPLRWMRSPSPTHRLKLGARPRRCVFRRSALGSVLRALERDRVLLAARRESGAREPPANTPEERTPLLLEREPEPLPRARLPAGPRQHFATAREDGNEW